MWYSDTPGDTACTLLVTLSPLARSFQKGWMKSQEPSFPVPSRVTRMAFFSNRAGRRLFTVRYLLLFMWSSCRQNMSEMNPRFFWEPHHLVKEPWNSVHPFKKTAEC